MGKILFIIIITFLLIILAFGLYALIAGWNTIQGKKGREEDLEYWRAKSIKRKIKRRRNFPIYKKTPGITD